jgi:hypothetical protein
VRAEVRAEAKQAESFATQVAGVAESAVLVPVGAALEVRDRVVSAIQPWTKRSTAEREITRVRRDVRRFERRGTVARNRLVRQVRQRRNQLLRLVRGQRRQTQRTLKRTERTLRQNRRKAQTGLRKQTRQVQRAVQPQVNRVQEQLQQQTKEARERVQQFV